MPIYIKQADVPHSLIACVLLDKVLQFHAPYIVTKFCVQLLKSCCALGDDVNHDWITAHGEDNLGAD